MTKLTLKNIPNLWGLLLLASYFALGSPIPKRIKAWLAARGGAKAPAAASAALHTGLGLAIAGAVLIPLLISPDPAYPNGSRYPTLLEALGRSQNAPIVHGMFRVVQTLGPLMGYVVNAGLIVLAGLTLAWLGVQFGRFKDRRYEELGPIKYAIVMGLLLMMMGVLGKIGLRLLFGIKYILSFPGVNLNI